MQRICHFFKGVLDFLFIIHYRLLLANFGDIQIGLVASGIKNGDLNYGIKFHIPLLALNNDDRSLLAVDIPLVRLIRWEKCRACSPDIGISRH